MPRRAWVYFWSIWLIGGLAALIALARLEPPAVNWAACIALLALAMIAQLFHAEAPNNVHYYATPVFIFAGALLLQPGPFIIIAILPALVEWLNEAYRKKNRDALSHWFVLPFNISLDVLSGLIARFLYSWLVASMAGAGPLAMVFCGVAAAASFMCVNHLLLGIGLVLRGRSWHETGMLNLESSLSDLTLLLLGYIVFELWKYNPWLIIPALSPLVLMYQALLVPKLKQEAQTDQKTGLLNARHFGIRFEEALGRARRGRRPLALIVSDLDYLRTINNTYGHLAGDAVLVGVGKIIGRIVSEGELAARFGGEEFAIVLSDVGYAEAAALAERIRQEIETHEFRVATHNEPIRATMSFGVACFPDDGATTTELFHQADIATYHAKFNGRNRVVCVSDLPQAVRLKGVPQPEQAAGAATAATPAATSTPDSRPTYKAKATAPTGLHPLAPSGHPLANLYIGSVIAAGAALGAVATFTQRPIDLIALGLLIALAIAMEWFQIDLYGSGSLSVSAAVGYAAALAMGIPGVIIISATIAITSAVVRWQQGRGRSPGYKIAFNWATHSLAGAVPALVFTSLPFAFQIAQVHLLTIPIAITALIYFMIDTGLIAIVVALSTGGRAAAIWREQYRWLIGHYLVLCFLGSLLTIGYMELSWAGLIGFALPIFMMRFAQQQYVQRTEHAVHELRRLNIQLTQANRSIGQANTMIQEVNEELLVTLARIIDARDPNASHHSMGVALYATRIATVLGLPASQIEVIRQSALLHDIGKIAIPEEILHKPGQLNEDEFRQIQQHAAIGSDLLLASHLLRHLAPFVRHHHERWDGKGYPDGLQGEQIPLEARILAVCDTIETMEASRSYQPSYALAEIMVELTSCSGSCFDPRVVAGALKVLAEQPDKSALLAYPLSSQEIGSGAALKA